ncbi:hypothetical protein PR048_010386 [Dryococelus australis]|uniref:Uncharacterized protein n=1 Tax=Dryococelus australis TaxID=614101 RepID=A0ABQ9I2P2_9NEOP|nr:hypothetical protein PR048_010386 [Dryococelus australis]
MDTTRIVSVSSTRLAGAWGWWEIEGIDDIYRLAPINSPAHRTRETYRTAQKFTPKISASAAGPHPRLPHARRQFKAVLASYRSNETCDLFISANLVRFLAGVLSDFRMWESCRTMPLVGGISRENSRFPRLIGSQDIDVKPVLSPGSIPDEMCAVVEKKNSFGWGRGRCEGPLSQSHGQQAASVKRAHTTRTCMHTHTHVAVWSLPPTLTSTPLPVLRRALQLAMQIIVTRCSVEGHFTNGRSNTVLYRLCRHSAAAAAAAAGI